MLKKSLNSKILLFITVGAILMLIMILAGCAAPAPQEAEPTVTPVKVTATPLPTNTATAVPPTETATQTPTATPLPTDAPIFAVPEGFSNLYIEYIVDASGSMLETLDDGTLKRDAARDFLIEILLGYNAETHLGLRAYGHRVNWEEDEAASCEDIELIAPVDLGQMNSMALWLMDFDTLGMTPLHASVEQALQDFDTSDPDRENNLVLISDGIETCGGDPCQLVEFAKREGVNFTLHVVGVAVDTETRSQLECIAEEGGGVYYDVNSADEFKQALEAIQEEHEEEEEIISFADATETARPPTNTPTPSRTPAPSPTPVPPTKKPPLPTWTPAAATSTLLPPTATLQPPTATQSLPTAAPTQATPTATPPSSSCVPPTIVEFKAIPPASGSTARFTLYYEVQGATRVEIFGNVVTPPSGTFDVWDNDTNYWVLWASSGDSNCYAEQAIQVDPDSISPSGSGLSDVDVDRRDVTISVRDHASVDGDRIDLFVNGNKVLSNYTLTSSSYGVAVKLNSGENSVEVVALNEGSSSPNTVEVSVSNVVKGNPVQVSTGLKTGQSETFKIVAP